MIFFNSLIKNVGVSLWCFETVLTIFIQLGQSIVYLTSLAGDWISAGDELSYLGSLNRSCQDLRSARACQCEQQALKLQGKYDFIK